jgi:predicted DNA repair protein MutK
VAGQDPKAFEDEKVGNAIATDFILSAEIMAITLPAWPGHHSSSRSRFSP